jgi:hypothetical protein
MNHKKQKEMKSITTIIALMQSQNSCPVQQIQSYFAIWSFVSIQACCNTMSKEQPARKMLTSIAKTSGVFEHSCEFYTEYCALISGTDPFMPSRALIQPNEMSIDALLKVTGGGPKMYT